jgi:hypothetical protein
MSKVNSKRRRMSLKIRHNRKAKISRLREKYAKASGQTEKTTIWHKASRLNLGLKLGEFFTGKPKK